MKKQKSVKTPTNLHWLVAGLEVPPCLEPMARLPPATSAGSFLPALSLRLGSLRAAHPPAVYIAEVEGIRFDILLSSTSGNS